MHDWSKPAAHRAGRLAWLASLALATLGTGCLGPVPAGRKPLSLDVVSGPRAVDFDGAYVADLKWLSDGQQYLERRDGKLQKIDVLTGAAAPAYDDEALAVALAAHADFNAATAAQLARDLTLFSEDRRATVLVHADRLYFYDFDAVTLRRLTKEPTPQRELTLSPDNRYVAFVKDNNLFAISTDSAELQQLTLDGSETLLNGVLDWVYQEEIYGRGKWRAYWWSPDGRSIAFLQLDESQVPVYPLVDYLPTHPKVTSLRYPKAGDPNPKVRLGVVRPGSSQTTWVDLAGYGDTEILIVHVSWSPDGKVVFSVQDRESRWLELNEADPETGVSRALLRETSPAWVDSLGGPHWLQDGSFLWLSARDGYKHLYHYTRAAQFISRVTGGAWEVRALHGVEEASDPARVYFSATRDSPVETHAYRVSLSGGAPERLTAPGACHDVSFDPHFCYFIDTFSNLATPTRVHLRRSDGPLVRGLSENVVSALAEYQWTPARLLRVPTPKGYELNAYLMGPPKMDPNKKYPVYIFVYGGPQMPMVENRWGGPDGMFQQWLAQQGYLVWACDPHSASGEGAVSAWPVYQQLGVAELADLEDSLRWLAAHESADLERVAIFGHSYGGYLVAYALTHSRMFKVGIAVAALTDWRNYDSVYAEKYLRVPVNDLDGYDRSSAVVAAARLHGNLLLLQGALDDNVHLPNTFQLMHALQNAEQPFDVMIYPGDDHGVGTYYSQQQRLGLEYVKRRL